MRIAHTLKGICGYMGAVEMVPLCKELKDAERSGELAAARISRPEEEFWRVRVVFLWRNRRKTRPILEKVDLPLTAQCSYFLRKRREPGGGLSICLRDRSFRETL